MIGDLFVGSAETYLPPPRLPQAEWDRAMVELGSDVTWPCCEHCGCEPQATHPVPCGQRDCAAGVRA